jgi:hypothetical protein
MKILALEEEDWLMGAAIDHFESMATPRLTYAAASNNLFRFPFLLHFEKW